MITRPIDLVSFNFSQWAFPILLYSQSYFLLCFSLSLSSFPSHAHFLHIITNTQFHFRLGPTPTHSLQSRGLFVYLLSNKILGVVFQFVAVSQSFSSFFQFFLFLSLLLSSLSLSFPFLEIIGYKPTQFLPHFRFSFVAVLV